jgi:PAS domain S-box-containing protein
MGELAESRRELTAERRLQLLIDSVRDYAIFMLAPNGRIETWNLGAELIKGYKPHEIIGKTIHTFYTPEDIAAGRPERLLRLACEHGRVEDEGWRLRKDGTRFWCDVVITALVEHGELVGFVKVTRDLTERRQADEQRLQQEHRFRALVETAKDYAIFMLDPHGLVATWNDGAHNIKGYTADEIVGQHFSRFYPPEDVAAGKCELELELAMRDGRFEDEGWRVRNDGTRFWANVVITPLEDRARNHIGFSKITRDLTDRRKAELDQLQLAHTQEALRLRDEFLSIAAHELRTPLVALQLQIESLIGQKTSFDPKFHPKFDRAGRNVQRLADLITALMDVSRISSGHLTLSRENMDLASVVAEVIDRLHEVAQQARSTVVADLAPLVGRWDPLRMGQVISNLLVNAFKYATGTQVDVQLRRDGDQAVLTVRDRGPGIADDQLERVFRRFERASSRNLGGLGLGLYVAREIVNAHDGTIVATNQPTGGASIEIRLPIQPKVD